MSLNPAEIIVLVIIAILLFGPDKLPSLARKAARVVVFVRNIANNAQSSIQSELGPGFEDFDIRDPKAFIRKKIDEQIDPITADVRTEIDGAKATFADTTDEFKSVRDDLNLADDAPRGGNGSGSGAALAAPFDSDAT